MNRILILILVVLTTGVVAWSLSGPDYPPIDPDASDPIALGNSAQ